MKKMILLFTFGLLSFAAVAQSAKTKYILIVRFKADFVPPSKAAIDTNIKHWNVYMGGLAKAGKLVTGYRPGNGGEVISGTAADTKQGPYVAGNELVSSFIIISADSLDDATAIAKACPVLEFGGSVEVRPLSETAN